MFLPGGSPITMELLIFTSGQVSILHIKVTYAKRQELRNKIEEFCKIKEKDRKVVTCNIKGTNNRMSIDRKESTRNCECEGWLLADKIRYERRTTRKSWSSIDIETG